MRDVQKPFPVTDAENAAIVLLQSYLRDEGTDDPNEQRQAEQELKDVKWVLNAERAAHGERLLFP